MNRWLAICVVAACGSKSEEKSPPPPPAPARVVPLGGDDMFDPNKNPSCLAATVGELKQHPHWMVRIDERTSFVPNLDAPPKLASVIERDANGARWHDGWPAIASVSTNLDAAAVTAIDAALAKSCVDPEAGVVPPDGEVQRFEIGYGPGGDASVHLPLRSEIVNALAPVFAAGRAKHVAEGAPHARTLTMAVAGRLWTGNAWKKWSATIDLSAKTITDADAVTFLDWARLQPETLPVDPHVVSGTLAVDGATRPVAVSLEWHSDRDNAEWHANAAFAPLKTIAEANWIKFDFH